MKNTFKKLNAIVNSPAFKLMMRCAFVIGIFSVTRNVFAGANDDLLAGTTTQALATMNGTGRNWAYLIDGGISLAAFAKTKNPFVFASVLAVAIGTTVIYKMAGGS